MCRVPPSEEVQAEAQARECCPGCMVHGAVDAAIAEWPKRDLINLMRLLVAEAERLGRSIRERED
jgi:hypothetical protein